MNLSYWYFTHASDPDGEDVACLFDWGDGTYTTTAMGRSGSLFRAEHVWRSTGVFQVRARATDSRGRESPWSQPMTVVVKLASTISIGISRASAIRGENLTVGGSVMPRGRYAVTLTFTRPDGSRLVEQVECDQNGNYFWVVSLDSIGIWSVKASWPGDQNYLGSVSELVTFRVDPPSYPVDFRSNVEGVSILVDGANCSLPHTFTWTEGSVHSVTAEYVHALSEGARYVFRCWGDGLRSCSRDLIVTGPAVYLLNYSIQYLVSVKMLPGANWSNAWYEKGTSTLLSVNSTSISVDNFSRLVFVGWSDNTVCPEINMTLDGPKTLEARWKAQFLVKVDSPYGEVAGGGWHDEGSQVEVSLHPLTLDCSNGTRRVFQRWVGAGPGSYSGEEPNITIKVYGPVVESATWKTQYLVEARSPYGCPVGSGWHDAYSLARISVEPIVILNGSTRLVFSSWRGDINTSEPYVSISVNHPVRTEAIWRKEFYLNVCSAFGSTWGSGWYPEGSTASFGVTPPPSSIIQHLFEGWTGDTYFGTLNATIVMDGPKRVVAKWRSDFLPLGIALTVVGFFLVLFGRKTRPR